MELNNITNTGTWSEQATRLNDNFNKVALGIDTLQSAYQSLSKSAIEVVDTLPQTGEANKIYRLVGTTSYSDYMYNTDDLTTPILMATYNNAIDNTPTANSANLVTSGGVAEELALGAVYDVSAKNPTAGSNNDGKWESLSALLSDANINTLIPISVRKGGMSVKFVLSSDNKYVQFRLLKNEFTTNVLYWEEVTNGFLGINSIFLYNGTINISNGDITDSATSLYSDKIIGDITLSVPNGMKIARVYYFNKMTNAFISSTYIGKRSCTIVPIDNSYARVLISKNDSSQITPSDVRSLTTIDDLADSDENARRLVGFDLERKVNVIFDTNSGSNTMYTNGTFSINDDIYLCVIDRYHCIDAFNFLTYNGAAVIAGGDNYSLIPNIIYKSKIINATTCGIWIGSTHCIGNGIIEILCTKNKEALLKYIDDNYSILANDIIKIGNIVGREELHQEYISYNVNTGVLVPGTGTPTWAASQKISIENEQTKVLLSFVPNAIMYFASDDSYLGYNTTGNIITNAAYFVIGLKKDVTFNSSMYYIFNGSNISREIYDLRNDISKLHAFTKGKSFAVIGDSLSAGDVWESKFAALTDAVYVSGYSQGGEGTLSSTGKSGMDRALKLLNEHPDIDIIFIQNINDIYQTVSGQQITDLPYMMTQNIVSSQLYASYTAASNALSTEIAAIQTPKVGTMLRIKYGTNAKKVKINNAPSTSGSVIISIGENQYAVTVNSNMSIADVQSAILAYDYTNSGFSDEASGDNAVLFTDTQDRGGLAPAISVDAGTTGIVFAITDATNVSYYTKCFVSKDIQEWSDLTKWEFNHAINRYRLYKGLISWLQTNFPSAYIFFLGLPRYSWSDAADWYKYDDGTYDWDTYRNSVAAQDLFDNQKTVSEYMRIPYLDVVNECAINIFNADSFYPKRDVHPNTNGYQRWGETVARLIAKY